MKKKRLLAILITLVMIMSMLPMGALAEPSGGLDEIPQEETGPTEGQEADKAAALPAALDAVVQTQSSTHDFNSDRCIYSADEWNQFSQAVTNGDTFYGQTVSLKADISVTQPVGEGIEYPSSVRKSFQGIFEGNGHTITINYAPDDSDKKDDKGVFACTDNGAIIRNLNATGQVFGGYNIGGIVGNAYDTTIENCVSGVNLALYRYKKSGTAVSGRVAGGIVGLAGGNTTIRNCEYNGEVSHTVGVGGIVGQGEGTIITQCTNAGTVKGTAFNVGGIIGEGTGGTIISCTNRGTVLGDEYNTGGIIGQGTGVTITSCTNGGSISGKKNNIGGVIGNSEGSTISDCSNNGFGIMGCQSMGGIAGNAIDTTIEKCSSSSYIMAPNNTLDNTGGIVGLAGGNTTIRNCTHSGQITGSANIGGIVGSGKATVQNCINNGQVKNITGAMNNVDFGGIIGKAEGAVINECTNNGNISGVREVGGIAGRAIGATINQCINSGTVSGEWNIGGIIGSLTENTVVVNVINTGSVNGNSNVGGIGGDNRDSRICNSANYGEVKAERENAGGIAGANFAILANCYCEQPSITSRGAKGKIAGYDMYASVGSASSGIRECYYHPASASGAATQGCSSGDGVHMFSTFSTLAPREGIHDRLNRNITGAEANFDGINVNTADWKIWTLTDGKLAFRDLTLNNMPYTDYDSNTKTLVQKYRPMRLYSPLYDLRGQDIWYVVIDDITVNQRITVNGNVHLVILDGKTLTINGGIQISQGNTLSIHGSYLNTSGGTLIADAKGNWDEAGIGGNDGETGGTVNIIGGMVTATGGRNGAGIGGGYNGNGGNVMVVGGTVKATGGENGAGIGGGSGQNGGNVTISGGTVRAAGGKYGAGIGGGYHGNGGNVTITGGSVYATAGGGANAIGSGIVGKLNMGTLKISTDMGVWDIVYGEPGTEITDKLKGKMQDNLIMINMDELSCYNTIRIVPLGYGGPDDDEPVITSTKGDVKTGIEGDHSTLPIALACIGLAVMALSVVIIRRKKEEE